MSGHHQKPRRNLIIDSIKPEELYIDSPEQGQPQQLSNEECRAIDQLFQTTKLPLSSPKPTHQTKKLYKPKKNKEEQENTDRNQQSKPAKNLKRLRQEMSQSQYQPGSHFQSSYNQEQSYEPDEDMDTEAVRSLNFLIKKFEGELMIPDTKIKKIKEIAQCLEISIEAVRRKVSDYFRRQKYVMNSSRSQDKLDHQTIYKKTQMFDDAIKRVLRVTPYACINDLREEIKSKLGLDLAKETLIRRLKNLKYNYKKFSLQKPEASEEKLGQLRKRFVHIYRQISLNPEPVFFYGVVHMALDECRGSMWMKNKQNGELDHIINEQDVLHIGIIATYDRIEFYKIYHGFYKINNFQNVLQCWLKKLDEIKPPPVKTHKRAPFDPRPAYLAIQANLIHYPEGRLDTSVTKMLKNQNILPIPFPPHSSQMNPAEVLFNQIKYVTRGKLKHITISQLSDCIESVINRNIDLQDIQFAFKKVDEIYKKY